MMTGDTLWLNLAILAISLTGFVLLALASQRHGAHLLRREPGGRERLAWRAAGWALLVLSLASCVRGWGWSIGAVAWLGWLCMAGALLVFALPRWTEQKKQKKAKAMPPSALLPPVRSRLWRTLAIGLLAGGPIVFAWGLHAMPVKPVLRADAVSGQIGPWPFTLAETDRDPPKLMVRDTPFKSFQVRFCDACDAEIRSAYLKVHKPRSVRGAGIIFNRARWDRSVEIQLPRNTRADSELWLTVEGKDGSVHHAAVSMANIAPATARWLEQRL